MRSFAKTTAIFVRRRPFFLVHQKCKTSWKCMQFRRVVKISLLTRKIIRSFLMQMKLYSRSFSLKTRCECLATITVCYSDWLNSNSSTYLLLSRVPIYFQSVVMIELKNILWHWQVLFKWKNLVLQVLRLSLINPVTVLYKYRILLAGCL